VLGTHAAWVFGPEPAYATVCKAWERAIEWSAGRPGALLNAAHCFTGDRRRALLERGEREAPSWPAWGHQLGTDAMTPVKRARRREDRGNPPLHPAWEIENLACAALAHFERALGVAPSAGWRFSLLNDCAMAALEADRLADALRFADATIAIAAECPDAFHRLDNLHLAHIVRGRVALAAGDLAGAATALHEAGLQGSDQAPVLRSYGPDFRLARLLFEHGKITPILAYLDLCAAFWRPAVVSSMRDAIARGEHPRIYRD
jgi:hypothetical protein